MFLLCYRQRGKQEPGNASEIIHTVIWGWSCLCRWQPRQPSPPQPPSPLHTSFWAAWEAGAGGDGLGQGKVLGDAVWWWQEVRDAVGQSEDDFLRPNHVWSWNRSSASFLALLLHRPPWLPQTWQNNVRLQPSTIYLSLIASCCILFLLTFIKKTKYLLL